MPGEPEPTSDESPPLIECDLPLGRHGLVAHNELVLTGWAASPKGVSGVAVQVDGRVWNASYGLDTPGLADRLPDVPGADRAGYRLHVDSSAWTEGTHYVTVAAFDRQGGRSAVEGPVEIRPFAIHPTPAPSDGAALADVTLVLDSPAIAAGPCRVEGPVEICGWAHAEQGIEAVVVTLDGTLQYEALRPIVRPDLLDRFGREIAAEAGFALRIDPADCLPGRHSLSVSALGRDGGAAGVEGELLCRPAPDAGDRSAGSPGSLDRMPDPTAPRLREEPASDGERMWRDRALLAEADAALCRAESNLARTAQEATLRKLRDSGLA